MDTYFFVCPTFDHLSSGSRTRIVLGNTPLPRQSPILTPNPTPGFKDCFMEWAKSVWWITILRLLLALLGKEALSIGVSRGQDRHLDQLSCFHEGRNCLRASQRRVGKRRRLILMISIEPLKPRVYTIRIYFLLLVHISHSLFWRFRSSLMRLTLSTAELKSGHFSEERWSNVGQKVATFQFCITHGILRARNKVWKRHLFPGLRERGGFFYK